MKLIVAIACFYLGGVQAQELVRPEKWNDKEIASLKPSERTGYQDSKFIFDDNSGFPKEDKQLLMAFSRSSGKMLDAITVPHSSSGNVFYPKHCKIKNQDLSFGVGFFGRDGEFSATAAYSFNKAQSKFILQNPKDLNCSLDCSDESMKSYMFCQAKLPCEQQEDEGLTDHCTRTYKCPPQKAPTDPTVGIMLYGNQINAIVSLRGGQMIRQEESIFSEVKEVWAGKAAKRLKNVSYNVYFDFAETGTCGYEYKFEPALEKESLYISTDLNLKLKIRTPTKQDQALFGKTYPICPTKECDFEKFPKHHKLVVVSDLNGDGNEEYWHQYADSPRLYYRASIYEKKTKEWKTLANWP